MRDKNEERGEPGRSFLYPVAPVNESVGNFWWLGAGGALADPACETRGQAVKKLLSLSRCCSFVKQVLLLVDILTL